MKIVLSVGGSLVVPGELDLEFVKKLCSLLGELSSSHEIAVVVGGGRLARKYINAAESSNVSDETKDYLGIEATHLNAMLVAAALGPKAVYKRSITESDLNEGRIVVTGGTTPGHSTDAVAAELAVLMGADLLVNASNVKGVYAEDPSRNPDAKLLERLTPDELLQLVSRLPQTPGKYALLDKLAAETIKEHKIKTIILGSDTKNIKNAIEGKKFLGTIIEI